MLFESFFFFFELWQPLCAGKQNSPFFCSGDFTQFHSVPGPYETTKKLFEFFSILSTGAHFVQQSRTV